MKLRRSVWCGWLVVVIVACGCGPTGDVAVYPVKGKVNFAGSPMAGGGYISFVPTGKEAGAAAGGEIKEDGTYELMTYKPGDGSKPGDFKVCITQSVYKEPIATADGAKPAVAAAEVPEAKRIPAIYNGKDSPLTAKVE